MGCVEGQHQRQNTISCLAPNPISVSHAVQAFQDLVDTKDTVTGKQVTPLANADNVAMLQMSGTLANR